MKKLGGVSRRALFDREEHNAFLALPQDACRERVEAGNGERGLPRAARRCMAAKTGEQWNACLAWLDRARQVDPEGEADPDVKELRARADNALFGKAPRREQPLRHPDGPQNP